MEETVERNGGHREGSYNSMPAQDFKSE